MLLLTRQPLQYHQAYPEALCIGPEGVKAKVSSVKWAGEYKTNGLASAAERFGFEDEIESCYFAPHPNKDIAFLHKPTKTLIQADLLFNLPANEQVRLFSPLPSGSRLTQPARFSTTMASACSVVSPRTWLLAAASTRR